MKKFIVGLAAVMFGLLALAGPASATGGGDQPAENKKVSKTFFEHTWENVTEEKLAARRAWAEELDRLMPRINHWRDDAWQCRVCGSQVLDRIAHWRFHFGQDQIMQETLLSLFGEDAQ